MFISGTMVVLLGQGYNAVMWFEYEVSPLTRVQHGVFSWCWFYGSSGNLPGEDYPEEVGDCMQDLFNMSQRISSVACCSYHDILPKTQSSSDDGVNFLKPLNYLNNSL